MRPSVRFNIAKFNAKDSLQHIYNFTTGFSGINTTFIDKMTDRITKRRHSWFGYINSPTDVYTIKKIIGKNGFYLKTLTNNYGVDIVWHERVENKFIVWGGKVQMIKTLHAINRKINTLAVEKMELESTPMDEPISLDEPITLNDPIINDPIINDPIINDPKTLDEPITITDDPITIDDPILVEPTTVYEDDDLFDVNSSEIKNQPQVASGCLIC